MWEKWKKGPSSYGEGDATLLQVMLDLISAQCRENGLVNTATGTLDIVINSDFVIISSDKF